MGTYTARAVELTDTEELAVTAASMVGSCRTTGLDVGAYRGLMGCAMTLGMMPAHRGPAWGTDSALVNAVVDLEDALRHRLFQVRSFRLQVLAYLEMTPETDEHAQAIADMYAALEILEAAEKRLGYAASRLARVPGELGETYEAVYKLVRSGRALPYDGRWITGQTSTGGTAA